MPQFVNLTPHEITVYHPDKQQVLLRVEPSGSALRVPVRSSKVEDINGVPINLTRYGQMLGLPDAQDDVIYIVSNVVLAALADQRLYRTDFVAPDNSPDGSVRNEAGELIGVTALQRIF